MSTSDTYFSSESSEGSEVLQQDIETLSRLDLENRLTSAENERERMKYKINRLRSKLQGARHVVGSKNASRRILSTRLKEEINEGIRNDIKYTKVMAEQRNGYEKRLSDMAAQIRQLDNQLKKRAPLNFECVLCKKNPREIVFAPCGHFVTCLKCAQDCISRCPTCRTMIDGHIKVSFGE